MTVKLALLSAAMVAGLSAGAVSLRGQQANAHSAELAALEARLGKPWLRTHRPSSPEVQVIDFDPSARPLESH